MGMMSIASPPPETSSPAHCRAHKSFLISNYILIGGASSCVFLTLSLRLFPSPCGFLLILLHGLTIAAAVAGCAVSSSSSARWYGVHMVATVVTAILQGAVALLALLRTSDMLVDGLKSYVREEDGVVILRMVGGLGVLIFCMEWVAMALAFVLRYYAFVDGSGTGEEEHGQGAARGGRRQLAALPDLTTVKWKVLGDLKLIE